MALLDQTAAEVHPTSGATNTFEQKFAGAAITAGDPCYLKASDDKYYPAVADDAAKDDGVGIAVNDAAANQAVVLQTSGQIDLGGDIVIGEIYVLGEAEGRIWLSTDMAADNYMTILGIAITTRNLLMALNTTGVVHG